MKKYKITYDFRGTGQTIIEAKNKEEAEEKYWDGDYAEEQDKEEGTDYEIDEIIELKTEEIKNN